LRLAVSKARAGVEVCPRSLVIGSDQVAEVGVRARAGHLQLGQGVAQHAALAAAQGHFV